MNEKEKWINDTLEKSNFIESLKPDEILIGRLKSIPNSIKEVYDFVPKKVVWAVAASVAILICVNFFSVKNYQSSSSNSISENYFSYMKQL